MDGAAHAIAENGDGDSYPAFLAGKAALDAPSGFAVAPDLPVALKPFQRDLTAWALRRGRAAIFAGTGLGKTLMQLAWADAVRAQEDAPILVLAPLAVAEQTVEEAAKFGIAGVATAPDGRNIAAAITITNYERLDRFDPSHFAGIVLDESSILKSQDSRSRAALIEAFARTPWRLACTATPAPNDYVELGNHAEFLGVMSRQEMLAMYFVHDGGVRADSGSEWRLKRHAARDYWRWVASWAAMIRSPSDLGYDEPGYVLPPLTRRAVLVESGAPPVGSLMPVVASTLQERLAARRDSIEARVAACKEVVLDRSFNDRLQPCGSRNIASAAAGAPQRTPNTAPSATPRGPHPTRSNAPNTCATGSIGIENISPSTGAPMPSGATPAAASAMPKMQNTASAPRQGPEPATPTPSATRDCGQPSASAPTITTDCTQSRAEGAPSAELGSATGPAGGSTSTIVTTQAPSEGCSAPPATSGLESSGTTSDCSARPSSTFWRDLDRPWLIWCGLNAEQDALARTFGDRAVSVYGSQSPEEKVRLIRIWQRGDRPILITKPSICGWGLNFQHCADMVFVGLNDSFEQLFQALRRCWRFGQTRPVTAWIVASDREGAVVANVERKEREFEAMAAALAAEMGDLTRRAVQGGRIATSAYRPATAMALPDWLTGGGETERIGIARDARGKSSPRLPVSCESDAGAA